ncbi:threonine/serine ThrE exporter family protein [Nocardioides insulae]|uniref:threonine/serine ThrE exporter family protein n=1 Tax=Nocardioides insulae TaxID=394734 RepID=UPI0004273BEB|nr:threonine/serine exporter family protein [Nocardioides insulae]
MEAREINLSLDFCLRVGDLLMSTGAGAADVANTMRNLARQFGLSTADIDVTFVNLSMHYQADPEEAPHVATRQVKSRATDYDHLTRLDHLVRAVLNGRMDLREARSELGRITSTPRSRPRWRITVAMAVLSGALAVFLGGDVRVALLAAMSAALIDRVQPLLARRRIPEFYVQAANAALATLLATAVAAAPVNIDVSRAITANIIVLMAGLGFVGAVQDALTGFYLTACARFTEVFLATAGIIAGVSGGLAVAGAIGAHIPYVAPGEITLQDATITIVGGAVSAAAWAYAVYAPGRIIAPIAVVGGVATAIYVAVPNEEIGRSWQVGAAALFIGLVSYSVAGRMRVPPLVIMVAGIVPLLPGLSIYRGLILLSSEEGSSTGLLAMFTAASIALALAAGVILGEYVAQPLKREARRVEQRLAGPRLVGPVQVAQTRRREDTADRSQRRAERRTQRRARGGVAASLGDEVTD